MILEIKSKYKAAARRDAVCVRVHWANLNHRFDQILEISSLKSVILVPLTEHPRRVRYCQQGWWLLLKLSND